MPPGCGIVFAGFALAAIKELHSRNKALEEKVAKLEKLIEDLSQESE